MIPTPGLSLLARLPKPALSSVASVAIPAARPFVSHAKWILGRPVRSRPDGHKSLPGAHTPTADRPTPVIFPEKAQICKVQSTALRASSARSLRSLVGTLGPSGPRSSATLRPLGLAFSFLLFRPALRRNRTAAHGDWFRHSRRRPKTTSWQDPSFAVAVADRRRRPPGAGSNASADGGAPVPLSSNSSRSSAGASSESPEKLGDLIALAEDRRSLRERICTARELCRLC